ncbi:MAG: S41 family peptidase [Bacteroidota bacterium]
MKILEKSLLILLLVFWVVACNNDDNGDADPDGDTGDETVTLDNEINAFVWSAMNTWYLWQDEVNDLADNRFADQEAFFTYLNGFPTPEGLHNAVLSPKDRFSVIVEDYDVLFNAFSGVATTNGVEFVLTRPPEGGNAVIGVVRYIIAGSDAEAKGVQRGDIFYAIDGTALFAETDTNGSITNSNLNLLDPSSYTLNFATIADGATTPNGIDIMLNKTELTENPILISKTLDVGGTKIGYVMYNSFVSNFDEELNNAFGRLKDDGVAELVIDFRYNGGGSVQSAIRLSSMITGQFTGEIFAQERWNPKWDIVLGDNSTFVDAIDETPLNSLNLDKVYIIATDDSASASELVMNCLAPYIEVVHVGDITVGKNEFSVTLVDNPTQNVPLENGDTFPFPFIVNGDETIENANPNHKYALQPLVGTSENADGFGEFTQGLTPDIPIQEVLSNLGELGDPDEPLLAAAIADIVGSVAKSSFSEAPENMKIKTISSSTQLNPYKGISVYDVPKK